MTNQLRWALSASINLGVAAVCLGVIVRCGTPGPSSEEVAAAREKIRGAAQPADPAIPKPPNGPRTILRRIEGPRIAQVYVDPSTMLAHRLLCHERTNKMQHMPLAIARAEGYTLDSVCADIKDPPQFREEFVTNPEWTAYEAALATYIHLHGQNTPPALAARVPNSQPKPAPAVDATPSDQSSANVQVKGYYRKDGTYVRGYTRSKPK